MTMSKHPAVRLAALGLALCLAPAAPARASEPIAFDLSAEQLCTFGGTAAAGDLSLAFQSPWCSAVTAGGLVEGGIFFHDALQTQIPQPPEFFGFFREEEGRVTFEIPGPPPAGVRIAAATLLEHLIVVWVLEEDGVSIFPIGDPIAFYLPAPPPYLAGAVLGKARYGEPIEMSVRATGDTHLLVVRQASQGIVAASTLKKIFAHPEAMSYEAIVQVDGDLGAATLLNFGDGSFRGVRSDAEVIIGSVPESGRTLGRIERVGSEVRVYPAAQ